MPAVLVCINTNVRAKSCVGSLWFENVFMDLCPEIYDEKMPLNSSIHNTSAILAKSIMNHIRVNDTVTPN